MKTSSNSKTEKKLLHYTGKAIADFNMIRKGDRVLACLSGGKDSYAMVNLLRLLRMRSNNKFELFVLTINPALPSWNDFYIKTWLENKEIPFEILKTNIYEVVESKSTKESSHCILCSRLRRGYIYTYAKKNGYNKIALGHHRDDLITSLLMSILYSGTICSMPPKLITDDKKNIVIRPLAYCQEKDIYNYAIEQGFPFMQKNLCATKENPTRGKIKKLIADLAKENPKIPSNILHALGNVRVSQLMDKKLWDFKNLEDILI